MGGAGGLAVQQAEVLRSPVLLRTCTRTRSGGCLEPSGHSMAASAPAGAAHSLRSSLSAEAQGGGANTGRRLPLLRCLLPPRKM